MVESLAIVLERPGEIALRRLELSPPGAGDVVVDIEHSGISTGTERLLWTGRMPTFPGMGYPLVPGYESVGRVASAGPASKVAEGDRVFVPGARCFGSIRGLFGGAASRLVVPSERLVKVPDGLDEQAILLALAGTARHAMAAPGAGRPDLVVGHGVLGRLLARLSVAAGGAPTVWETNPIRAEGARGYTVLHPDEDPRRDYEAIYDVSGDASLLDTLIGRVAPAGEIVLAGFYEERLSFTFPPAFMKEARIRVAAEWKAPDMAAVCELLEAGRLELDGLITHRRPAGDAAGAYRTAFEDPACLKMLLDWRGEA